MGGVKGGCLSRIFAPEFFHLFWRLPFFHGGLHFENGWSPLLALASGFAQFPRLVSLSFHGFREKPCTVLVLVLASWHDNEEFRFPVHLGLPITIYASHYHEMEAFVPKTSEFLPVFQKEPRTIFPSFSSLGLELAPRLLFSPVR